MRKNSYVPFDRWKNKKGFWEFTNDKLHRIYRYIGCIKRENGWDLGTYEFEEYYLDPTDGLYYFENYVKMDGYFLYPVDGRSIRRK